MDSNKTLAELVEPVLKEALSDFDVIEVVKGVLKQRIEMVAAELVLAEPYHSMIVEAVKAALPGLVEKVKQELPSAIKDALS